MRQAGGSIEKYYNDLQGLWREIDFRRPNPMECASDIHKYNSIIQEERVYIFLDGLDDRLDKIRSDVLQMKPFPTVEQAYAHVRREEIRQAVMITGTETTTGAVMASKGVKMGQQYTISKIGSPPMSNGKPNKTAKVKMQSEGGGWVASDGGGSGRAAFVTAEPQLSFIPHTDSLSDSLNPENQGLSEPGENSTPISNGNEADDNDDMSPRVEPPPSSDFGHESPHSSVLKDPSPENILETQPWQATK
ncbi:hypothetical protein BUALT_Bualt15G0052500 [Buddleja alternifolia]|uniref:Retrotransposon gag domain-containing protein n=1 Tax=Buddleja alternifolia TaxID=168488 RepID=A0AAV6WCU8_9LAMI|nr:hypothetical protein BUALT_Bualt15G0052500 [Buddleja alternifolia]